MNHLPVCCWKVINASLQQKMLEEGIKVPEKTEYSYGAVQCGCGREWQLGWHQVEPSIKEKLKS